MSIRYELEYGHKFVHDLKLAKWCGLNMDELKAVTDLLQAGKPLPENCRDHLLVGNSKAIENVTSILTGCSSTNEKMP